MVRVPDAAGQLRSAPIRLLRGFFSGIGQLLLAADRHQSRGRHKRLGYDRQLGPPTGLDGVHPKRSRRQSSKQAKRSSDSTGNVRLLTPDDPAETVDNIRRPKLPRPGLRTARPAAAQPQRKSTAEAKGTSRTRHSAGKHRAGSAAPAPPILPSASVSPPSVSESPPAASAPWPDASESLAAASESLLDASESLPDASSAAARADLLMPGYEGLSLPAIRARLRGLDETQLRILIACEKSSANRVDIVTMFERRIAKLEAADRHAT